MSLTPKQQRFVEEYLIDLNGKQAAIRAGYSAKTAEMQASRLLSYAKVSAAIAEAKTARSQKTQIDAEWLLRRFADDLDADIADLYDENGGLKPVRDWPAPFRKGLIAGIDVEEIWENGAVVGLVRKIKLADRTKVKELIGRHVDVGAFKDKVEHSGKVEVETLSDEALSAKIAAYLGKDAS